MAAMIAPTWPTDMINAPADTQAELPMLSLRHGQVAWTLPRGLPPSQGLLDQLRYLQQLRVPLEREELGMGRGYRLRHRFDHRIELGGPVQHSPGHGTTWICQISSGEQTPASSRLPPSLDGTARCTIDDAWVKSRGTSVPILADEVLLRLHILIQTGPGPSKKSGSGMLPC